MQRRVIAMVEGKSGVSRGIFRPCFVVHSFFRVGWSGLVGGGCGWRRYPAQLRLLVTETVRRVFFSFLFLSSSLGRTRPIGRDRILEVESLPLLSCSSRREFSLPWSLLNRDLVTMFIGLESCTKRRYY